MTPCATVYRSAGRLSQLLRSIHVRGRCWLLSAALLSLAAHSLGQEQSASAATTGKTVYPPEFAQLGWQPERRNLRFTQLDSRDGLAQAIVNSVTQDAEGFMWFGTQEGLTRYDGRQTTSYLANREDATQLQQDWIWTLLTTRSGTLWIGTNGGGLARYRPRSDDFVTISADPKDPAALPGNRVRALHEDHNGHLWVGTIGDGLSRFDPATGKFTRFRHDPQDPGSVPGDTIVSIVEDRMGVIWVGTEQSGIARYDETENRFIRLRNEPAQHESLSDDHIRNLTIDNSGRLWVATYRGGLNLYDPTTESFRHFRADADRPDSLPSDLVRDVLQDHLGNVWVATDDGLAEWIGGDRFITYTHDPQDRDSLSSDPLIDLFVDRSQNLWIASYSGVNKWNYVSDQFNYYDKATGHLREEMVTAIVEAADGTRWVGTYGGGLTQIDDANRSVRTFRNIPGNEQTLADDRIMAIAIANDGTLYLGTRGNGLDHLDPATGIVTHYVAENSIGDLLPMSAGLKSNGITSLLMDPDGALWIGTYGGGLSRLQDGRISTFRFREGDPDSLSSDKVVSLMRDSKGDLWIGTEDAGLNRLTAGARSFIRYQPDPNDPEGLQTLRTWLVFEDSSRNLWIGTMDSGLSRWAYEDRETDTFRLTHLRKEQLQGSDSVLGIEEDQNGMLWITSNKGLTEFNPNTFSTRRYDVLNGLRGNEFMMGVSNRGRDGALYFGSATGLLSFFPGNSDRIRPAPEVAITVRSRNRVVARGFSTDISPPTAELSYPYYSLTFEFAALDYVSPDKNKFAYQLAGFDTEWLDPGAYPRATYTNLPAGNYTFLIRAANSDGVWLEDPVAVAVTVIPPPWRSRWAFTAYFFIALLMVGLFLRSQRNRLRRSEEMKEELQTQVQERTLELQQQNEQLADLNEQLKQASITDPLTGLRNRRFFYEVVKPSVAGIDRHYSTGADAPTRTLFFMMIDLDGFKKLNDKFGHHAGDRALAQLATLLTSTCRETDVVCRWGGDEFLILGEVSASDETESLADRIRERIEAFLFDTGNEESGRMTASIGVCSYPLVEGRPGVANWETVSQLADQAAYIAKSSGKNRWARLDGTARLTSLSTADARHSAPELVLNKQLMLVSSAPVSLDAEPAARSS